VIPNHDPSIRGEEFFAVAPNLHIGALIALGFLPRPPTVDLTWVRDESWSYADFNLLPSGMTPSPQGNEQSQLTIILGLSVLGKSMNVVVEEHEGPRCFARATQQ
jgi:hypothetical protein